jgi:hypothetical protein
LQFHQAKSGTGTQERACEIDRNDLVPLCKVQVFHRQSWRVLTGVIEENIQAPKLSVYGSKKRIDGSLDRHIRRHHQDTGGASCLSGGALKRLYAPARQHNRKSRVKKGKRGRTAYPAASTGYNCDAFRTHSS